MLFTLYTTWMGPSNSSAVVSPSNAALQFPTLPPAPSVPASSEFPSKIHPTATRDLSPAIVWSTPFEGFVDDDLDEDDYE